MDATIVVAIIAGAATVLAAVVAGVFALKKPDKSSQSDSPTQAANASSGGYAITAGGNVHIGHTSEKQSYTPSKLEITHVGFTHEAEFDVKVRNLGDDAIVINKISILLVKDYKIAVAPILRPTAKYKIPVDGLKEGELRSLDVSHVVDAHKADRFLIELDTTQCYRLRVTFHYNLDDHVSFEQDIW